MKLTYLLFIFSGLFFQHVYSGVPGACLEGQVDNRSHSPSEYFPVIYSFSPLSSSPRPLSTTANTLKVFSWNIQSNYALNCTQVLPHQMDLMSSYNADFVGLQETDIGVDIRCNCNIPQAAANANRFNAYFMQMFPYRNGKYGDIASFGYSLISQKYLYFNVTNTTFERRGALASLVKPQQLNGFNLWYINTHLEQTNLEVRKIQVAQLTSWVRDVLLIQDSTAPVVITGDFYTLPGDGSYEEMATYFSNAWAVYNGSAMGGFTHPSDAPTQRDDHIWFKSSSNVKITVNEFVIIYSLLSDHRPIYATLSFTTNGSPSNNATNSTTGSNPTANPVSTGANPISTTGGGNPPISTTGGNPPISSTSGNPGSNGQNSGTTTGGSDTGGNNNTSGGSGPVGPNSCPRGVVIETNDYMRRNSWTQGFNNKRYSVIDQQFNFLASSAPYTIYDVLVKATTTDNSELVQLWELETVPNHPGWYHLPAWRRGQYVGVKNGQSHFFGYIISNSPLSFTVANYTCTPNFQLYN